MLNDLKPRKKFKKGKLKLFSRFYHKNKIGVSKDSKQFSKTKINIRDFSLVNISFGPMFGKVKFRITVSVLKKVST